MLSFDKIAEISRLFNRKQLQNIFLETCWVGCGLCGSMDPVDRVLDGYLHSHRSIVLLSLLKCINLHGTGQSKYFNMQKKCSIFSFSFHFNQDTLSFTYFNRVRDGGMFHNQHHISLRLSKTHKLQSVFVNWNSFNFTPLDNCNFHPKFRYVSPFAYISLKIASINLKFCKQGYFIVNFKPTESHRILKCSLLISIQKYLKCKFG